VYQQIEQHPAVNSNSRLKGKSHTTVLWSTSESVSIFSSCVLAAGGGRAREAAEEPALEGRTGGW